ncbi:helix-turn-helix domain-containing protein [Streptomyces sp. V4-01]|uniref:Helix-turn-helix domain-containing protein n=1 Tax=Actinacidiphila polyblastidii TaxID=3110430 RepID=A0ABU7PFY7_9ACTN|nr:helix-turn-helix domain-containing protein [Streptomyces sp. V4-01]
MTAEDERPDAPRAAPDGAGGTRGTAGPGGKGAATKGAGAARRPYDARRRRAGAERNRGAVLDAYRVLLFRDGYRATTVRAVAGAAGVSPETVYKTFGGKPGLAKALWDVTQAGDDAPVAMADRDELRAVMEERDPRAKLAGWAAFVRGVHERLAGLAAALAQAGPEPAAVIEATEEERLRGVRGFVEHLADRGLLGAGVDPSAAADACWALTSAQLWTRLTVARGWTAQAYEEWLVAVLAAVLF